MRITQYFCSVLVLAALLGGGISAGSDEPAADENTMVPAARSHRRTDPEAHGLLAGRISSPAAATQSHENQAKQPAGEVSPQTVQPANWAALVNSGPTPAIPPLAAQEPALSPLATDDWTACDCCPNPLWCHRSGVFADLLYLRPGNIDYIYAVEQTGTLPTDSPTGPVGRVGFDAALGYRIGGTYALSDCSSIQASYTWFQNDTQNSITANNPNVLIFQPGVPQIPNVGASAISAAARYNIRFQQADIDYRGLLYGTQ